jgi:hypothetical protein
MEPKKRIEIPFTDDDFVNHREPVTAAKITNSGIDPDFGAWGDKTGTIKNFEKVNIGDSEQTSPLPNIKDEKAFDDSPVFTDEGDERLPTDTLNERDTMNKFMLEDYDK